MRDFDEKDVSVRIKCRKRNVYETVFFSYVTQDGKTYTSEDFFQGCDIGYCGCDECEACKREAYQILFGTI